MPRPLKPKRICKKPLIREFGPEAMMECDSVCLTLDEYETIRLIDLEGVSREACAERMDIARTTAQDIYNSARLKIAQCIVNGKKLFIDGGNFSLCDGSAGCPNCCKRKGQCHSGCERTKECMLQEQTDMKIAVTYDEGSVFQHFGKTQFFKVFDVEDKQIKNAQVISSNGAGHGALAGVLADAQVTTLICGGIGGGAQVALSEKGITVVSGAEGDVDTAVKEYLAGKLVSKGATCDHHHHEEGHSCGDGAHHSCH